MSLERFGRNMKRRGRNVPREVNKVKRTAALAVDQALVLATPVDTGTARSNWQVSLDAPNDDTIEAYAQLIGGDQSEVVNAQEAMEQGKISIGKAKPGQEIHITNNLPYITALNEGHSAQAPAAFVEEAVEAGHGAAKIQKTDTGKRN